MKKAFLFVISCLLLIGCEKKQPVNSEQSIQDEIKMDNEDPLFICWITSEEGLRVRDIPNIQGNKIGLLNYQAEVQVYEIGNKEVIDDKLAFWLKINFKDRYGWIFGGYVTIIPEKPFVETDILSLTEKNLIGIWTQGTDSSDITDFRFVENFEENGRYTSGMLYSSMGTIGTYKIDEENQEIIISESEMDDEYLESTIHEYKLSVKKLTSDELIYEYDEQKNNTTETVVKIKHRIPQRFLDLEKASTIEWLRYINKYGNEELFTGSTVFMYCVLKNQTDVAVFLINSDIDINHENKSGEKAVNFLRKNEDDFILEILKSE